MKYFFLVFTIFFSICSFAFELTPAVDLYASDSGLMPYSGKQSDLSTTVFLKNSEIPVTPFFRYLVSNYRYQITPNTTTESDNRESLGLGIDINLSKAIKLRYISERIKIRNTEQVINSHSYGLIISEYLNIFNQIDLDFYLESFYIPLYSEKMDTFAKAQLLSLITVNSGNFHSHAFYPFLQAKVKYNDDQIFGLSGQNTSLGVGYKFYYSQNKQQFSIASEIHQLTYQSQDFNADWTQLQFALQYLFN